MTSRAFRAVALLPLLAACAAPPVPPPVPDETSRVDAASFLQAIEDTPYECADYEASSESCSVVSTYTRRGSEVLNRGVFLVDDAPPLRATGRMTLTIREGQLCGDLGRTELSIEGADSEINAFITDVSRQMMGAQGVICATIYRTGPNRYVQMIRNAQGEVLPDGQEEVVFFATPKAIRYEE